MSLTLPPLPYAIDALEPFLSRNTLAAHHGHHHAAYVAKARTLVQRTPLESAELEEVVLTSSSQDRTLFNASAQAWNHTFFWYSMRPRGGGPAHGAIAERIEQTFGSQSAFNQQFIAIASDHFASGWIWLALEDEGLRLLSTHDAETPLTMSAVPLLTLDVWEHAYYLDYQHRRIDYVAAFLAHLVDWGQVNQRLESAMKSQSAASRGGISRSCHAASNATRRIVSSASAKGSESIFDGKQR
jgi:Fe-Mn family superoxide dismutase